MHTISEVRPLRQCLEAWQKQGQRIALVPTMGNLHAGHLSLIEQARQHADKVVATVFVNPLQFGPNEDFDQYPRTLSEDQAQCQAQGADVLFAPAVSVMYPGYQPGQPYDATRVQADAALSSQFEGADRPGHFDGVVTVVSKLFHLVQPNVAVFGQKDLQQFVILQKMVHDLAFPIDLIRAPIVRQSDGLALSSRNQYLSEAERAQAPLIRQTLTSVVTSLQQTPHNHASILQTAQARLQVQGFVVHYLAWVRLPDLQTVTQWHASDTADGSEFAVMVAATLGRTRLLDNAIFRLDGQVF
ncbi:pantoate--beta-alanine ligase [Thiomicrospira sp. WB1]|uniref:pantoate--beta-alanine ligase n=1 Tax=Thiomicrospira sp. WB1 TaxID=1685380 RepID=UPI000747A5CB|nr:pantoate--beta-alanine ligase [Thiomicrospira sp. WB1]KUJ71913.1 hypothetical protein AVO41_05535 [Thiomicrospira sp. WB1]